MSESDSNNLKTVTKGGLFFGAGSLCASFLKFLVGIIIIRLLEQKEYGLISMGYVLVSAAALLGSLGMNAGIPRLIAKARENKGPYHPQSIAALSLFLRVLLGLVLSYLLFQSADTASKVLSKPDLAGVLRVFSFLVFPLLMIQGFTAVFQGYQNSKPKAVFQDVSIDFFKLILIGMFFLVGLQFQRILLVYVAATWIAFFLYVFYFFKNMDVYNYILFEKKLFEQIFLFCLPLLGVGLINQFTPWIGTILMGFTQPASEIAVYNAPQRLMVLLHLPLASLAFIYTPTATRLYSRQDLSGLRALYVSTTKWGAIFTFPLALYFFIDAEYVVTLLFGEKYVNAANVLRIFSIGYLINTLAGPSAMTLISAGDARSVLGSSIVALLASIFLGVMLIPSFGALGASCASMTALILSNLFLLYFLIKKYQIYPYSKRSFQPMLIGAGLLLVMGSLFLVFKPAGHIMHAVLLISVFAGFLVMILLAGGFDSYDIEIVTAVEQRIFKKNIFADWLGQKVK